MIKKGDYLPIVLLALLWTPTFLIVKMTVDDSGPFTLAFTRCFLGGIILSIVCFRKKLNLKLFSMHGKHFLIAAFLLNTLPFSACAIGEIFVDSSTAGIIEGSTPVFTLLIAKYCFKHDNIGFKEIGGILLGFFGLIVIFLPTVHAGGMESLIGLLFLLLMAIGFASGFLYTEKHLKDLPSVETTTILLFLASIMLFPFSLTSGGPYYGVVPSNNTLYLLLMLGITTGLSWLVYFWAVKKTRASSLSIATMLVPVLCIITGWAILSEVITWYKIVGTTIVLASIFLLRSSEKPDNQFIA